MKDLNSDHMHIGFWTALFLILLTLKLTNAIAWSWWWVTAPLWGPFVAFFALAGVALLIVILTSMGSNGRRP